MEECASNITKLYLETLSFDELAVLADECGIDVPKALPRTLLISDLLEESEDKTDGAMDEANGEDEADEVMATGEKNISDSCTPTDVSFAMSGPLWAFVYWNVGGRDALKQNVLFLRINSFDDKNAIERGTRFIVEIADGETGRFVLLPRAHKYVQIDLVAPDSGREDDAVVCMPLATSNILKVPRPTDELFRSSASLSPVQRLSGMAELAAEHYRYYRSSLAGTI